MSDKYSVTIVKYGTRVATKSDVYLNYSLYREADESVAMDYYFWIVQNEERVIVVDTGFSKQGGENRQRTLLHPVADLFANFGVDASNSPTVILTHAHYDHIGNLNLFPTSPIVIAKAELDFWAGPHAHRIMFHHSVEDEELATLQCAADEGRVTTFHDRLAVAPGVEVIRIGGHTPGQSIVKICTSEGVVLLASDAIHYYEEYDRDMLFMSVASLPEMYEGFDRIRAMENVGEIDFLVSGHDPDTLARFSPVDGPYGEFAAVIGDRA